MMNCVAIIGRLTKDPELRHTQSDVPVASFTLAVDRGYKKEEVDFINIVAWRGTAEFVSKWFSKGQLVAVSGRLQVRSYKDRDGNNRTATEVVADEVFFAESKRNNAEGTYNMGNSDFAENVQNEGDFEQSEFSQSDFEVIGDDEPLPF